GAFLRRSFHHGEVASQLTLHDQLLPRLPDRGMKEQDGAKHIPQRGPEIVTAQRVNQLMTKNIFQLWRGNQIFAYFRENNPRRPPINSRRRARLRQNYHAAAPDIQIAAYSAEHFLKLG